jgi:hypothetical protein
MTVKDGLTNITATRYSRKFFLLMLIGLPILVIFIVILCQCGHAGGYVGFPFLVYYEDNKKHNSNTAESTRLRVLFIRHQARQLVAAKSQVAIRLRLGA